MGGTGCCRGAKNLEHELAARRKSTDGTQRRNQGQSAPLKYSSASARGGVAPLNRPAWGPPYRQTERYASNCVPGPTHGPARWEPYRCSYRRGRASSRQEGATGAGKRQKRTGSALVAEISSRCRGLQRSALRFRTESGGTRKKAFIHCPLTPADPGNTLKWSDLGLTILEIYDD